MKIISYFKMFLIIAVLAFFSACKSYEIPFDKSLEGKTISTGFYVCDIPAPYVDWNGAILKIALHSESVQKAYSDVNLKEIIYDEFLKNGATISPKIRISIKSPAEKEIVINQIDEAKQSDPKASEFIVEGMPEKLGKDYIFIIRILSYGMGEGRFSVFSKIDYIASIIDMRSNKKVWQKSGYMTVTYPITLEIGYASQKDSSKVRSNLQDCVAGIVKDISIDINKVQIK